MAARSHHAYQGGLNVHQRRTDILRHELIRWGILIPFALLFGFAGTFGVAVAETRAQCVTAAPLYDLLHRGELYKMVSADQTIPGFVLLTVALVLMHPQRSVIFRRVFLLHITACFIRGLLIMVTSLPDPHPSCRNRVREFSSWGRVAKRGFALFLLPHQNEMTCCDLIVSGHCLLFYMLFQVLWRYFSSPNHLLRWYYLLGCIGSMTLVIMTRMHYTIDAVVACFLAQILWQNYHLLIQAPPAGSPPEKNEMYYTKRPPAGQISVLERICSLLARSLCWWDSESTGAVAVVQYSVSRNLSLLGMLLCSFAVLAGPSIRIWTE